MKNVMMTVLILVGSIGFSQEKHEPRHKRENRVELTAEQRNDLRLKQMTLKLDLTAAQQKEMAKIIADQETKRAEAMSEMKEAHDKKTKPTADEMYAMKSKRLDAQIENRAKMKKILNEEQFAKWEKMDSHRKAQFRKGMHDRPKKGPEPQD